MGHAWFISTVLLSACGFYMWPHTFGAAFTAKNGEVLRRNAIVTPLYTISLAFIFIAGFAALLLIPGLSNGDMALLMLARKTFPAWFLGVIEVRARLPPWCRRQSLSSPPPRFLQKNVYRPLFAPSMTDDRVARLAKVMVLVLSLISFYLALHSSTTLVALLLLGYAGVTQVFSWSAAWPLLAAGDGCRSHQRLIAGLGTVAGLMLSHHDPFHGVNAGFLALCVNSAITLLVSKSTPAQPKALP